MTRAQSFVSNLLLFSACWLTMTIFVKPMAPKPIDTAILLMPLEYLVMLGLYAVGNIAYHLITFKECPGAAKELSIQVKEAKIFLKAHGFTFNN